MTKRLILEVGLGNDLYGKDYTKAACRAVQDALHHSSLVLFRSLNLNSKDMIVNVTIGVQEPEKLNKDEVAATLPHGTVTVFSVLGGQNIIDKPNGTEHVIAIAAIEAFFPIVQTEWKLTKS